MIGNEAGKLYDGYLKKSPPPKLMRQKIHYKTRFFVLRRQEDGRTFLEYSRKKTSKHTISRIPMDACQTIEAYIKLRGFDDRFAFSVVTPRRTYFLMTKVEEEMNGWVDAICKACQLYPDNDSGFDNHDGASIATTTTNLSSAEIINEEPKQNGNFFADPSPNMYSNLGLQTNYENVEEVQPHRPMNDSSYEYLADSSSSILDNMSSLSSNENVYSVMSSSSLHSQYVPSDRNLTQSDFCLSQHTGYNKIRNLSLETSVYALPKDLSSCSSRDDVYSTTSSSAGITSPMPIVDRSKKPPGAKAISKNKPFNIPINFDEFNTIYNDIKSPADPKSPIVRFAKKGSGRFDFTPSGLAAFADEQRQSNVTPDSVGTSNSSDLSGTDSEEDVERKLVYLELDDSVVPSDKPIISKPPASSVSYTMVDADMTKALLELTNKRKEAYQQELNKAE